MTDSEEEERRGVSAAAWTLLLLFATLAVVLLWLFLLRTPGAATPLYSDSAQSVSNAPGP
jgi:hypothetical protein